MTSKFIRKGIKKDVVHGKGAVLIVKKIKPADKQNPELENFRAPMKNFWSCTLI